MKLPFPARFTRIPGWLLLAAALGLGGMTACNDDSRDVPEPSSPRQQLPAGGTQYQPPRQNQPGQEPRQSEPGPEPQGGSGIGSEPEQTP